MESSDMAWLRIELTTDVHGAMHIVSRRNAIFGGSHDGLCGAECFSLLIRSTPLPKGIKLSDGVVKFNGQ
jgi:hypothetical protein